MLLCCDCSCSAFCVLRSAFRSLPPLRSSDMSLRDALNKPIVERKRGSGAAGAWVASGATTLTELLAPDGVDRRWSHMVQVGDSYLSTLEVRSFPPSLLLAWLTDPGLGLDAPG